MRFSLLLAAIGLSLAQALSAAPGDSPGAPAAPAGPAGGAMVRIKELARVSGVRNNQLFGYGLVVGLDGSGDSNQVAFTARAVANLMQRFGVSIAPETLKTRNVAAVVVTADLPPFVREGNRIDVLVSSVGDARTLQGGTLLQTPLEGADGQVYAVAQGPVSIGGFAAGGRGANVTRNHPTVGRIPNGAIVEREVPVTAVKDGELSLLLSRPDYATAARVVQAINRKLGAAAARSVDAGTVRVRVPAGRANDLVGLVAELEVLPVETDTPARVVINERTGTVVIGGRVVIAPVAVSHGGLVVEVAQETAVSQPAPLSGGHTVTTQQPQTRVQEEPATVFGLQGATVEELVKALNALRLTPRDIIAILQAIKQAGAMQAELEVI
ncbi:MAG: flagellar basal body P-ring protein FlgI [Armatimonadetes bacterium]|jgi:flagellar P-ring protein precursor FlgI|nr:flagellar basal body P-ring protein FlgI [Armatimonadota bacterium]